MKKKTIFFTLLLLAGGIICGSIIGVFIALTHDLPQIRSLEQFKPSEVTRIFSSDNVLLAELYIEKRDLIPLVQIPRHLKEAIIATEDRSFYRHSGIDLKGVLRAALRDILAAEFVEGASTITQQLAKTLFLTSQKTIMRKIKEAFLAFQLERRYTKAEILQLYLNQIYFGSGAYGVASAAQIYFGKPAHELNIAECALIAGLPKAPSRYSPIVNKSLALNRRNTVLRQMLATGIILQKEFQDAVATPIHLHKKRRESIQAPYFVDYVKRFLKDTFGSSMVFKAGLSVYTTLSFEFQKAAENAVLKGLDALQKRMQSRHLKDPHPQAALVALNIDSGAILALVGGSDFSKSPFNRAIMARRQPGSAFKPIVYAYAIEQGFTQNHTILDAPVIFKGLQNGMDWKPENFSKKFMGQMTLRKALGISENIPAVKLIEMLGTAPVAQFGRSLGIESPLRPNLSLALGTSEVSLLELTAAYAVFADRGRWIRPYGVKEIRDRDNRILWQINPEQKIAMSRTAAAIVTDMLQGVVQQGTGRKARRIKHPIAGKTGTTDRYKDALFIGFSPAIAAGVWVGHDRHDTLGHRETGAKAALPIWIDFMSQALSKMPYQYFDIPDDVVKVAIDPVSGQALAEDNPHAVMALFKKGTEPRTIPRK